jgi:hypothetical protein
LTATSLDISSLSLGQTAHSQAYDEQQTKKRCLELERREEREWKVGVEARVSAGDFEGVSVLLPDGTTIPRDEWAAARTPLLAIADAEVSEPKALAGVAAAVADGGDESSMVVAEALSEGGGGINSNSNSNNSSNSSTSSTSGNRRTSSSSGRGHSETTLEDRYANFRAVMNGVEESEIDSSVTEFYKNPYK